MSSLFSISALQKIQYHFDGSFLDGNTCFSYLGHRGSKTLNLQRAHIGTPLMSLALGNQEIDSFLKGMGLPRIWIRERTYNKTMCEDEYLPLTDAESKENNSEDVTAKPSVEEEYRCEHCGIVFHKKSKYLRHVRTHTKEVIPSVACFCSRRRFNVLFQVVANSSVERNTWQDIWLHIMKLMISVVVTRDATKRICLS